MTKIIITEDDDIKLREIQSFLVSLGVGEASIVSAKNLAEFSARMSPDIDICIIDVRIPAYEGGEPHQNGQAILQIMDAKTGGKASMLAISSFPEEFEQIRPAFERRSCVLASFHDTEVWQSALKVLVLQASSREQFDFLIFAALPKERSAYLGLPGLSARPVTKDGINRVDLCVGPVSGSLVLLPEMGIVDAAVMASRCIDRFSPKLVAMSGICAGFSGRAELGQLLVSSMAYEYQSGKWTSDGFSQGPYQVPVSEKVRSLVRELFDNPDLLVELESGWRKDRPSTQTAPDLAVFTSGSAVIASGDVLKQISEQHRKVAGLDMEVFAIHRAAQISISKPDVVCAKVVVDLADSNKDGRIHDYGCFVSAKFIVDVVRRFFQ